jgi:hypothetical protein
LVVISCVATGAPFIDAARARERYEAKMADVPGFPNRYSKYRRP